MQANLAPVVLTDDFDQVRSECDEIMLRHAATCGAKVFEETRVTDIEFDESGQRPVAALWKDSQNRSGRIELYGLGPISQYPKLILETTVITS